MVGLVFIYVLFLFIILAAALLFFVEENDKWSSRLFLAAWLWPLVAAFLAVYIPARYGRAFVTNVFQKAELHELVKVERDQWTGVDDGPVGRERNKLSKMARRWV